MFVRFHRRGFLALIGPRGILFHEGLTSPSIKCVAHPLSALNIMQPANTPPNPSTPARLFQGLVQAFARPRLLTQHAQTFTIVTATMSHDADVRRFLQNYQARKRRAATANIQFD
jgi:hypothetical protein